MNTIVGSCRRGLEVFAFGSCVSCGCWDGVGDADFTAIRRGDALIGRWPPWDEKRTITSLAAALRRAGFFFNELQPVLRTRVPVVRREQKVRPPLHVHRDGDVYSIKCIAPPGVDCSDLLARGCGAAEWTSVAQDSDGSFTLQFADSSKAVAFFCDCSHRLHIPEMHWDVGAKLPEVFSLDFDLSCRVNGLRNSWFLRRYFERGPAVRAGYCFVKKWSKGSGVNNSKNGYLSSYAVSILWIYFLLRSGEVSFVDPASVSLETIFSGHKISYLPLIGSVGNDNGCGCFGDALKSPHFVELRDTLGRLVCSFFSFYARFDWDQFVVTLRVPETEPLTTRGSLGWTEAGEVREGPCRDRVWYRMCIEDPYENNLNLGRHLSPNKASFVKAQFVRALALVVGAKPQRLLFNEQAIAKETLTAHVSRLAVEGAFRGSESVTVSALQQLLKESAGEDYVALYESTQSLGNLSKLAKSVNYQLEGGKQESTSVEGKCVEGDRDVDGSVLDEMDSKCKEGVQSNLGNHERSRWKSLQSAMNHLDKMLSVAGPLGVPEKDVSAELRGVYFLARGKAFKTAEDRDVFLAHTEAITTALACGHTTREGILKKVMDLLPSVVRLEGMLNTLLDSDNEVWKASEAASVRGGSAEAVQQRGCSGSFPKRRGNKDNRVVRGRCVGVDSCDQCGAKQLLWDTSRKSLDSGRYCSQCWMRYDRDRMQLTSTFGCQGTGAQ